MKNITQQVIEWRRYLHQYPEPSFQEYQTSEFIYQTLLTFKGLEVSRPTDTSVMARLVGKQPGKVIALRADIDGLPIQEANFSSYASKQPGLMHACGHDGHTAILLGCAKILAMKREQLKGEVRFLFQHAEEQPPGGAQELLKTGALEGVDIIVGAHLWAPLPLGKIVVKGGPLMAGGDQFTISIHGRGGHAGMPHEAVDPIPVAVHLINQLQLLISRDTDPLDSVVLSITKMKAGDALNVIPDVAEIGGTVRYFDPKYRHLAPKMIEQKIKALAGAYGVDYQLNYQTGYFPVINDPEVSSQLASVIEKLDGIEHLSDFRPLMVGEDFSSYLQQLPGCFFLIGAGKDFPHHHPRFDIDEQALKIGMDSFVHFIQKELMLN